MNLNQKIITILFLFLSIFTSSVFAGDGQGKIVIIPVSGFSDTTVVPAVGGNYYTTVGEQRMEVFKRAAFIWSTILDLHYDVTVNAQFTALACSSSSATLGFAGPAKVKKINNVWYSTAQANQINKNDTSGVDSSDINAQFNSSIDSGCYSGSPNGWYYGLDNNPPAGKEALLDVVLHELGHGLGFLSLVNGDTGAYFNSYPDAYIKNLKDLNSGKLWTSMTNAERVTSARNNNLFWNGNYGNTFAGTIFSSNSGYVSNQIRMYNPSTYNSGSSVSHISTHATPNQLMEPFNTTDGVTPVIEPYMFKDMGYNLKVDSTNNPPVANNFSVSTDKNSSIRIYPLANSNDVNGDVLYFYRYTKLPDNGSIDPLSDSPLYIPNNDFIGTDTIEYEVYDSKMKVSNTGTINISVSNLNSAPVALNDVFTVNEDSSTNSFNVLQNDTDDASIDVSTLTIVSQPLHGIATVNSGNIIYTPTPNYNGSDSLIYNVKDSNGLVSNNSTVTINVSSVNDAPVSNIDSFNIIMNSSNNVIDILFNDTDSDNSLDYTNIVIVTQPTNGSLSFISNYLTYTPNNNYSGNDGFTYRLNDGFDNSNTSAVSINVINNNTAPVAVADTFNITEDVSKVLTILSNDSDDSSISSVSIIIDSLPEHGDLELVSQTLTYNPDENYNGVDSFSYHLVDFFGLNSSTVTVSLNITPINDAPVANNDSYTINEDTISDFNVLSNDIDIEDSIINYENINILNNPNHGSVIVTSSSIQYTPTLNYNGTDSFVYSISDSNGLTSSATVNISINSIFDQTVTLGHSYIIDEDNSLVINLNDNIVLGDSSINSYIISSTTNNGTLNIVDNIATYKPNENFSGTDIFSFYIVDSLDNISNTSTINIIINPINDSPVTLDDNLTVDKSTNTLNILINDYDIDNLVSTLTININDSPLNGSLSVNGSNISYTPNPNTSATNDSFTYSLTDLGGATSNQSTVYLTIMDLNNPIATSDLFTVNEDSDFTSFDILYNDTIYNQFDSIIISKEPTHGIVVVSENLVSYSPNQNFSGTDEFEYLVLDNYGLSSESTSVSIVVNEINDAPIATEDLFNVTNNTKVRLPILSNDIDENINNCSISIISNPSHGSLTLENGSLFYETFNTESSDSFVYKVIDNEGLSSNNVTVNLNITNVINLPLTLNDKFDVTVGSTYYLDVSFNDMFYTDSFDIEIVNSNNNDIYVENNKILFNAEKVGSFTFVYKIIDSVNQSSNTSIVTINVSDVYLLVTNYDYVDTNEDTSVSINVLSNDVYSNIQSLLVTSNPTNGYVSVDSLNNNIIYTPDSNFEGTDRFEYTLTDGSGQSSIAIVQVNIIGDNTDFISKNDTFILNEDNDLTVDVLLNDLIEISNINLSIKTQPLHGSASVINNKIKYLPEENFTGKDNLVYVVTDLDTYSTTESIVNFTINDINDKPVSVDDSFNILFNTESILYVLNNDYDIDSSIKSIIISTLPNSGIVNVVDNYIVYTPYDNFVGNDYFEYYIKDSDNANSVPSKVNISVDRNVVESTTSNSGGGAFNIILLLSLLVLVVKLRRYKIN